MKVRILSGQCLLDIAIQVYGSVDAVERLAEDNGLSVDARLDNGAELVIDPALVTDERIRRLFKSKGLRPATEYAAEPPGPFTIEFNDIFFNSPIHSTD